MNACFASDVNLVDHAYVFQNDYGTWSLEGI